MLPLHIEMMNTLWKDTYRATVTNESQEYLATLRIIVNVPKDPDEVPEGAPQVPAQLFVLVEDAVLDMKDIIDFETACSSYLDEQFKHAISHMFYFYPSPEDMLSKDKRTNH